MSCNPSVFEIDQGSNLPKLETQLLNLLGAPVDLSDSTVVLHVYHDEWNIYICYGREPDIVDVEEGRVEYQFSVSETLVPGTYEARFEETHTDPETEEPVTTKHYMTVIVRPAVVPDLLAQTMTLADLNRKITDATLDDQEGTRDPNPHSADHHNEVYGLIEALDSLPEAGTKDRAVLRLSDFTVHRDDGEAWQQVAARDLADLVERAHGSLTGVGAGDHHAKTGDNEVYGLLAYGLLAERPQAGVQGRLYWAYDAQLVYWDTGGAEWIAIAAIKHTDLASVGPSDHHAKTESGEIDHGGVQGLADDDHGQYLNQARHDLTERHALGSVVPHDALASLTEKAHGSLSGVGSGDHHAKTVSGEIDHGGVQGLADDDHAQYLNPARHDLTERHALGSVVPHDALASLTEKAHGSLSGIGAGDHHAKTGHHEVYGLLEAGALAERPAAATAGRFYFTTDEGILYRDSGATWVKVAVSDYPDLDDIPTGFNANQLQGRALDGQAPADGDILEWDAAGEKWAPGRRSRYIDRGDPSGFDHSVANDPLTVDGAWHDLDLGDDGVTDPGPVLAHIRVAIRDDEAAGTAFQVRQNGNENAHNSSKLTTQAANLMFFGDMWVMTDADQIIEYKIDAGMNACNFLVRGWIRYVQDN